MQIGVLGAVTVHRTDGDRTELAPAGPRLRGLLARLSLDAGHPVGTSVLVDALWGQQPPDAVGNALQSLVSRLRRALGPDIVVTAPGGYRLDVAPERVDAVRFATLRRAATDESDPRRACELLRDALALWRGPALADVRDLPFAEPAAARLAGTRADAVEALAARGRDAGDPGTGLDALRALLDEQPLRESTAVALAWGLLAGGRQVDALDVLDRTRDALAESLGMDPGPELARTRMAVLRGEYEVAPREPVAAGTNGHRTGAAAPAAPATLRPPPAAGETSARSTSGTNGAHAAGAGSPPPTATRPGRTPALTTFVGRDADVARVRGLLGTSRPVTVTGPGGAGKTRLGAEVTAASTGTVAVVELAPLTGDEQLPSALLHAVGGPEMVLRTGPDPVDPLERLRTALAGRDLLLVLDNCEHLVGAVAELVQTLLGASAGLRVLATSREPLGITGEVLHPLGALSDADAARLFVDRAAAVRPGFDGTGDDAGVVAEICRRLDGQPLPIELAAARVAALSPREIAARLDDRFRLLTTGSRTALPRHQTLRAVVDWSWDLLTRPERRLLARMGVFAGPVGLDVVQAVCGDGGSDEYGDVFDLLAVLVDKSLVLASPDPDGGPTRYLMLETIREYATARLGESGERETITAAHARWARDLVERAEPLLRTREQLDALGALRRAEGEITLALHRAVAARDVTLAHRLLAGMLWSWMIRGALSSAEHWADEVWALPDPGTAPSSAVNRTFRALLRAAQGDTGGAAADIDELTTMLADVPRPWHPAVTLAEPLRRAFTDSDHSGLTAIVEAPPGEDDEERWLQGAAAQMVATVAENEGDLDTQRRMLRVAHARFTELGDRFGLGMSVSSLGELEDLAGESDAARVAFAEAVDLATELGNVDDAPQFRMRLAGLAARTGDIDTARAEIVRAQADAEGRDGNWFAYLDASRADIERRGGDTAMARTLLDAAEAETPFTPAPGAPQREASMLAIRASIELDEGRLGTARDLLDRAAVPARASGDGPVVGRIAEVSARWALTAGDPERAGELLGVAIARRGTIDHGDPETVAVLDGVRSALGDAGADTAMARGRSLPRDHPPGPSAVVA